MSDLMGNVAAGVLVTLTAFVLFLVGYQVYDYTTREEYLLPVNEWTCSTTEDREVVRMQLVGKVIVPIKRTENVCVEYKRV